MNATLGSTVKDFRDSRERAPRSSFLKIDPLMFLEFKDSQELVSLRFHQRKILGAAKQLAGSGKVI